MKLFDKLKNALFEEEYVEVEEKKAKSPKKEKPIAKKIVLPEQKKEEKQEEIKEIETPQEIKKDFKFPAILEDDFIDLTEKQEPAKEKIKEKEEDPRPLYSGKKEGKIKKVKPEQKPPYGKKEPDITIGEYGGYEKKIEKKEFRPSPIISPIYGVLDQNYKKEDIVTRKDVRLTSSYSSKNIDVDSVRAKAYGIENDNIFEEELAPSEVIIEDNNDVMLDISDNAPEVAKVTVGDAEEYFQDLGLEYNIDYKDASHEKATGRRTEQKQDQYEEKSGDDLEDNLFDLIDSMYEDKKGE